MTSLAEVPSYGPPQGYEIIGQVTEAMHKWLLDGYELSEAPPRFEEDMKFVPKDREEVIYIYMYRVARNPNLMNQKRWRQAPVFLGSNPEDGGEVYYHRPPLLLDLFYLVSVHSKFRSDAERLIEVRERFRDEDSSLRPRGDTCSKVACRGRFVAARTLIVVPRR